MEDFEKKNDNINDGASSDINGNPIGNVTDAANADAGVNAGDLSLDTQSSVSASATQGDDPSANLTHAVPSVQNSEPAIAEPDAPPAPIYHWNYDKELADADAKNKKRSSRGAVVYAVVVSLAFILCFAALVFALLFDVTLGSSTATPESTGNTITETVVKVEERVVYVREADSESGVLTSQEIYNKCLPSTVNIIVSDDSKTASGSGFFISSDGYIATAYHVIENMTSIKAILSNGEMYEATIVDGNEFTDLAVIKINKANCPAIAIGSSDALLVGDDVVAIGTPAAPEFSGSMAKGIVAYKNRMYKVYNSSGTAVEKKMRVIQTDTLVNPGNSGCPLINEKGEFVGIVTMKLNSAYYEGICFAIPSDTAMPILRAMIDGSDYSSMLGAISTLPAALGITGENVQIKNDGVYGVRITSFASNDYDISKKLAVGDIITKFEGSAVATLTELRLLIDQKMPGEKVTLTVYSSGEYKNVVVVLGQ